MERFARRIASPAADDPEWPAAMATLHHLAETYGLDAKPSAAEQARLLRLLAELRADAGAKAGTDRDALFWAQALESIASFAQMRWAATPGQFTPADNNPRDAQMGKNLVWLANVWYPNRKIIVWAASSHIARDVAQLRSTNGSQPYATGWSVHMGGEAYQVLGTQMYAIGFTAAAGAFGPFGTMPIPMPPMRVGSLEAHFEGSGHTNAFVDFRSAPAGGEWLRSVYARPFGYGYLTGDWTRVLDGMVFTYAMEPSTPATR
jgi:erythromycin esterase-like protein